MDGIFIDDISHPTNMLNKAVIDVMAANNNAVRRALSPHTVAHITYLLMHAMTPSKGDDFLEKAFQEGVDVSIKSDIFFLINIY